MLHHIRKHIIKHHRIRKKKESSLPLWKRRWNDFNENRLGWLEHFVDFMIPWLVLLLLLIIIAEFAYYFNFFGWTWIDKISKFMYDNETSILLLDDIIVGFFIVDLYFNFFKKRTFLSFLKTSFLDILAVAPVGLIFRVAGLEEAQSAVHLARAGTREAELTKVSRIARVADRIPKFTRLYRIGDFWKKK